MLAWFPDSGDRGAARIEPKLHRVVPPALIRLNLASNCQTAADGRSKVSTYFMKWWMSLSPINPITMR